MNPKTFRVAILVLATVGILFLIFAGVVVTWLITRQHNVQECPVLSCPLSNASNASNASQVLNVSQVSEESEASCLTDQVRDRRVMNDPLYPPLNRTDARTFNSAIRETDQGRIYSNPRADYGDTYRLVGYLSSADVGERDAGDNRWKLFGRMKNHNQGDFYIIPANRDIDLKIPLTPEVVISERLRDVYSLPEEMRFRSPLLNNGVYHFVEIPKADFSSTMYA